MGRLCERPGCSEPASVAYGMRPEDLVFWLDQIRLSTSIDGGVLCQRHADTMVVPRNWTLDDLRDPDLHLFRPPEAGGPSRKRSRRDGSRAATPAEQLELGVDPTERAEALSAGAGDTNEPDAADQADPPTDSWSPTFDSDDDLDGLLSANSPLLARAFRGDDRPRPRS